MMKENDANDKIFVIATSDWAKSVISFSISVIHLHSSDDRFSSHFIVANDQQKKYEYRLTKKSTRLF